MPIEQGEEINRDTPDGRLITALEMAIKALEQTEPEKCGDCISRQAVIDRINKLIEVEKKQGTDDCGYGRERVNAYEAMLHFVKSEYLYPSIEPEKCGDCISRQAAEEKLKKVVDEMALIFADIREKNIDDSVCGLCEYDCDHGIDGCANECPGFERDDCFKLEEKYRKEWTDMSDIPSVEPESKIGRWIEHEWAQELDGEGYLISNFECDKCHAWAEADYAYCPNCGVKMEVET